VLDKSPTVKKTTEQIKTEVSFGGMNATGFNI